MTFVFTDLPLHRLLAAQQERIRHAYRPGTISNHKTQLRAYYTFCRAYGFGDLRPSEQQLCLYIEYLAQKFSSAHSVKNYLAAVGLLHKHLAVSCKALSSFRVSLMLRALDRTMLSPPHPRRPVSAALLHQLVQATCPLGIWGLVMKCAILLAFFGFLRQSNLAPRGVQQFDPKRHTRRKDIVLTSHGVYIKLRWTKTIQTAQQPTYVPLPRIPASPLCPVTAFMDMAKRIPVSSNRVPLLVLPGTGTALQIVTIPMLSQQFASFIRQFHLPPKTFSLHSLRRGGASLAFEAGVSLDQIKSHGTWKSQAVWKYIHSNTNMPPPVPAAMASAINQCI